MDAWDAARWWMMRSTSRNEAETTNCYVYCFCSGPAPEDGSLVGIGDSKVRTIQYDGVVAIVSDCYRPPEPSIPNAVAHNRVVSSILEATTPLPCRFGTTLSQRDLEIYVASRSDDVKALLGRFQGCVEMTLRIAFSAEVPAGPFEDITRALPGDLLPEPRGPGARFLEEKMREANQQKLANQQAQAVLDWVDDRFTRLVRDSVTRRYAETTLPGHIAHLLDRGRLREYHELLTAAQSDRPDLQLTISGPWAPYSFAILDKSTR